MNLRIITGAKLGVQILKKNEPKLYVYYRGCVPSDDPSKYCISEGQIDSSAMHWSFEGQIAVIIPQFLKRDLFPRNDAR